MRVPASHSKGDVHPPTGPPLTEFWSEGCLLLLGVLPGRAQVLKVSTGPAWGTGWGDALSPHPRGWWAQQVAAELSLVLKCLAKDPGRGRARSPDWVVELPSGSPSEPLCQAGQEALCAQHPPGISIVQEPSIEDKSLWAGVIL